MGTPHTELSDQHKEFLHGLFTTALEGGIDYWSACSKYHWSTRVADDNGQHNVVGDIDNFIAVIEPTEDNTWGIWDDNRDTQSLRIDLDVMARGARLMYWYVQGIVDGQGKQVPLDKIKPWPEGHYHWQYVKAYASNGEDGDYDAGTADCIVQFGLFGEVVYG